jgi:hypothetical protein
MRVAEQQNYNQVREAIDDWHPVTMRRHMAGMMDEDWSDPTMTSTMSDGKMSKGDIIMVDVPYLDASQSVRRPACTPLRCCNCRAHAWVAIILPW